MMKTEVINKTRGTTLGAVRFARTFMSRFRGLMLRRDVETGLVLEIPEGRGRYGSGIHMFFMLVPLDILFLDGDMRVVDTATLRPWQLYNPAEPAKYVIELREGSIRESKTEVGDVLEFRAL
ncbi:DUF192 domain-containing protein [Methanothermobacter thermautotrophicus]|jgi:uncharacterized membrane protein (UPF0127 family)|uniref:UPF0127 protein DNK57_04330 n=1 Tax=Methanothermobacter thermautotrophicus TaxID=145262 RepID=A0A842YPK0_METTF|nr:DUF192 domain-containing protein [Methanothermobacter thermautotrophicus]MBE2900044.1 DUF192 domain-containing protein [Methanothermobacter thermautotrophicus]MCQ8904319.1 DUF192 domain-containing protein [Methanothermobacter sp.]